MLSHKLRVTITLGNEDRFASSGKNTIIIDNLRVIAGITQFGGQTTGTANVSIYGMLESDMNQVTTLSTDNYTTEQKPFLRQHSILIEADGSPVFDGIITNAWGMYQMQPDVYLHIEANELFLHKVTPLEPTSIKGVVQVADIFKHFADIMKLNFENNGVDMIDDDVALVGSAWEQAAEYAKHCKIELAHEGRTLIINRRGQARQGKIPLINEKTGLVGYPSFDTFGVSFKSLFNPAIRFLGLVRIETPIKRADGEFRVQMIKLLLESEKPGGAWFMDCRAIPAFLAPQKA